MAFSLWGISLRGWIITSSPTPSPSITLRTCTSTPIWARVGAWRTMCRGPSSDQPSTSTSRRGPNCTLLVCSRSNHFQVLYFALMVINVGILLWILIGNDPFPSAQPRERALLELFLSQLTPVNQDHIWSRFLHYFITYFIIIRFLGRFCCISLFWRLICSL